MLNNESIAHISGWVRTLMVHQSNSDLKMVYFLFNIVTTTKELKMIGNCLRYSRAILSFDKKFDSEPYLQVYKEILTDLFNVPQNHPKSKPFVDHVFNFCYANNRIYFRHYQVISAMNS